MPISDYFSNTYAEARKKFCALAQDAGAHLSEYTLPDLRGPSDELLAIDVATLGPSNPDSVLILISATHGVEGFCGSGCQCGYLADQFYGALPANVGTILIHALNPYGFAWLRRVNEDNIDLNRNFLNFGTQLPDSSAYEAIHDCLVPEHWVGPNRQAADNAMNEYIEKNGMRAFLGVATGGQYTCPNGLFYGGVAETWSNRTLRHILADHIAPSVTRLAVLDFHTGLR